MAQEWVVTDHIVFNSGARDLAVVEDFESLQTMASGDVAETFISDLHTAVQLQHGQVVGDGSARAQAPHALIRDTTAIGHALHNNRLELIELLLLWSSALSSRFMTDFLLIPCCYV